MQSKFVIAALLGAISANQVDSLKEAISHSTSVQEKLELSIKALDETFGKHKGRGLLKPANKAKKTEVTPANDMKKLE